MRSFILNHRVDLVEVTIDDDHPNVLHIDRDVETILVQTAPDRYEVRKGRWLIGSVTFYTESHRAGWRFEPHGSQFRRSRKLFRFPEDAIERKLHIARIFPDLHHQRAKNHVADIPPMDSFLCHLAYRPSEG